MLPRHIYFVLFYYLNNVFGLNIAFGIEQLLYICESLNHACYIGRLYFILGACLFASNFTCSRILTVCYYKY